MTHLLNAIPRTVRLIVAALVLVVVGAMVYVLLSSGAKNGTAYFKEVKSVYPGDAIRILGMEVGKIDKITGDGNKVRVDFHYDSKYVLPAGVRAAILSPTLVATRFIQLDPAYVGGPTFPNGGAIPEERTVEPVEFDELKTQLSQLADALGPNGVNQKGALNRALSVIDANGRPDGQPQGQNFHDMLTELSKAAKVIADGRGDLFGTVRHLAQFSSVLSRFDSQIVEFDHALADVSGDLNDNSDALRGLLPRVAATGHSLDRLLDAHTDQVVHTIEQAGSITRALAERRNDIAQLLHIAPTVLTDFNNIWHPRDQALLGTLSINELGTLGGPGDAICAMMSSVAAANEKQGQDMCVKYLGPVFAHLRMQPPPIGVTPLETPRGSTPSYGDLGYDTPNTNHSPNGSNSDLPRSSTANGNDRAYQGPGGLIDRMQGGN
jgi:phospholipid/cholesterol/gamma-HCH transport system substrate-binding protein